jgi:nicotinate-nucleotide adenylyltransferase
MNVALFGGTFDPVHLGHLAVARAAASQFDLKRVYFVPAFIPPHKSVQPITAFGHRYAMVALATTGEKMFVPSLLESPEHRPQHGANYSIDTIRNFKPTLGKSDRLFFLIGIDAFLEISTWREPEALLREAEFIVVSRPGFSLADVGAALPEKLRPSEEVTKAMCKHPAKGDIVLSGATIHLLEGVAEKISATQIRSAAERNRPLDKLVGGAVADYMRKQGLYRSAAARAQMHSKSRAQGQVATNLQVFPGGKARQRH